MQCCGSAALFDRFEEENQRHAPNTQKTEQPEVVNECPKARLLIDHIVKDLHRLKARLACALALEHLDERRKSFPKNGIQRCDVFDEARLSCLRAARYESRHRGNAQTAAEVAHQIEKARGIGDLFLLEVAHRGRGQRHENG